MAAPSTHTTGAAEAHEPHCNVYIAGLPIDYGESKLRDLMSTYGDVQQVRFVNHKLKWIRVNRAYGFTLFSTVEAARAAIQGLAGTTLETGDGEVYALEVKLSAMRTVEPRQKKAKITDAEGSSSNTAESLDVAETQTFPAPLVAAPSMQSFPGIPTVNSQWGTWAPPAGSTVVLIPVDRATPLGVPFSAPLVLTPINPPFQLDRTVW